MGGNARGKQLANRENKVAEALPAEGRPLVQDDPRASDAASEQTHAPLAALCAIAVNDEKRGATFPVTLALSQKQIAVDGKMVGLAPGMNLVAEIKTGKRRVIEYLLSPIQKAGSESLRER
jgi:hypothetical protein